MAAVVVTSTRSFPAHQPHERPPRPALQLIDGGRRAARAYARSRPDTHRLPVGVYRRRRLGLVLAVVSVAMVGYLALVGLGTLLAAPSASARATHPVAGSVAASGARYHVVQPGDTLWSIARALHPSGDIRAVVDQLETRAGGATLVPGQRVRVDGLGG
jgi:hypothetical protein